MAEQADRFCAVCEKPIDLPRVNATAGDVLCADCLQLRQRAHTFDDSIVDEDLKHESFERTDYDLHVPGAL